MYGHNYFIEGAMYTLPIENVLGVIQKWDKNWCTSYGQTVFQQFQASSTFTREWPAILVVGNSQLVGQELERY